MRLWLDIMETVNCGIKCFKNIIILLITVYESTCACHSICVGLKGQLCGFDSLYPPFHEIWWLNLGYKTWLLASVPTEQFYWPSNNFSDRRLFHGPRDCLWRPRMWTSCINLPKVLGWGCSWVAEHLSATSGALGSILSTVKNCKLNKAPTNQSSNQETQLLKSFKTSWVLPGGGGAYL